MPNYSGVWTLSQQARATGVDLWPTTPKEAPTGISAVESEGNGEVSFSAISDPTVTNYRASASLTVPQPPPTTIGQSYGGGYYAGKISYIGNGVATHYLIVAPRSTGETDLQIKTSSSVSVISDARNFYDGFNNTDSFNNSSHPAFQWARALTIGGYTDWYVPSIYEMKIIYYFLKATTDQNSTNRDWGQNPNSVEPYPTTTPAWTAANPAQTSAEIFQGPSGVERIHRDQIYSDYWTSTAHDNNSWPGWGIYFRTATGEGYSISSWIGERYNTTRPVRAIRKVEIAAAGVTATAATSPITVPGLTVGFAYTFTVAAGNTLGYGPESLFSNAVTPTTPPKGYFAGGEYSNIKTDMIQSIVISSGGTATDYADLSSGRDRVSALSSSTRGVFGGGTNSGNQILGTVDYKDFATTGTAISFGNLNPARIWIGACSNSTRGLFASGFAGGIPSTSNVIEYLTIASTGGIFDFGDLSSSRYYQSGCSSSTRGVFAGGVNDSSTSLSEIDYVTIASTGNSTDFGNLSAIIGGVSSCSNSTRGLIASGSNNTVEYITIASTGNSLDFGDLTSGRLGGAACSSSTRGIFGAGSLGISATNVIEYITINSLGNSVDFGDLVLAVNSTSACSTAHGGLQ